MPLPKIDEVRNLSDEELGEQIVAIKRELFQLRLQQATGQGEIKPHQFKHLKHRQSQLLMVERQRQLTQSQSQESATPVEDKEES
ncbi:50S ribosomal protein L29 [Roseofilum sp. BLCC_M91]|uniref:Large ribosomal subunit protein uL29 n=1 Tax=Roseofilum halophilum BLCC-M91 TaxID=3022259 RepID=A0ABT7BGN5_9CYAN|nr:50S ribosomal protein L29 [Roseofilum halophilum]MDJ1178347.1 50S ribosomal protein L29 [Roseofilum halophilum BLCC-M91]